MGTTVIRNWQSTNISSRCPCSRLCQCQCHWQCQCLCPCPCPCSESCALK
jgi:hypothetical protein